MFVERKIGINTSFFNCESFVEQAFQNIERLNYSNFEWRITDDFSTDNTRQILEERLQESSIREKIRYCTQESKKEMYWHPNRFFDSSFEWIYTVDADDEVHPDFISIYNRYIDAFHDITFITSDFHKINKPSGTLHSISNVINKSSISEKINRYHPEVDYLANTSYYCYGVLRGFKNINDLKFNIIDQSACANESYLLFWMNSYGKYLHIPRPLYTWNKRNNSESHSIGLLENFNANFKTGLQKLVDSDKGVVTFFNDVYTETCTLGSIQDYQHSYKNISLFTRTLSNEEKKKIKNLYKEYSINFNTFKEADIYFLNLTYIENQELNLILEQLSTKAKIILYFQNQNLHLSNTSKDIFLENKLNEYLKIVNEHYANFSWWTYIRHFRIEIN